MTTETIPQLPPSLEKSLAEFATTNDLTIQQATYVALRKAGMPGSRAYIYTHPGVTEDSASVGAARWNRKLAPQIESTSLSTAMAAIADMRVLMAITDSPTDLALKAVDIHAKLTGRYQDPGVSITIDARQADVLAPFTPKDD